MQTIALPLGYAAPLRCVEVCLKQKSQEDTLPIYHCRSRKNKDSGRKRAESECVRVQCDNRREFCNAILFDSTGLAMDDGKISSNNSKENTDSRVQGPAMYKASDFCQELARLGSDFYTGVPDSVLKGLCNFLNSHPPKGGHIQAANEGGAIALAVGRYLATGRIPVVYMQNSGLGNAVNPLLSLADAEVYAIPMLLLIGWRGEPGGKDEPQHMKQGRITLDVLDTLGIPYGIAGLDWPQTVFELEMAYTAMRHHSHPYALVVQKGCLENEPSFAAAAPAPDALTRDTAIRVLVECADDNTAFIASTGLASRELYDIRTKSGEGHERDFLNVGAMGHASMIALGIAGAQPGRRVVCLDGDGALLMHMGSLPIIGQQAPANLTHVLLNNGVHDSVGGQPNAVGVIDPAEVAAACGYKRIFQATSEHGLRETAGAALSVPGPVFWDVRLTGRGHGQPGRPSIPCATMAQQFGDFLRMT